MFVLIRKSIVIVFIHSHRSCHHRILEPDMVHVSNRLIDACIQFSLLSLFTLHVTIDWIAGGHEPSRRNYPIWLRVWECLGIYSKSMWWSGRQIGWQAHARGRFGRMAAYHRASGQGMQLLISLLVMCMDLNLTRKWWWSFNDHAGWSRSHHWEFVFGISSVSKFTSVAQFVRHQGPVRPRDASIFFLYQQKIRGMDRRAIEPHVSGEWRSICGR